MILFYGPVTTQLVIPLHVFMPNEYHCKGNVSVEMVNCRVLEFQGGTVITQLVIPSHVFKQDSVSLSECIN